jgi:ATP-dependent Lhr-like helicase
VSLKEASGLRVASRVVRDEVLRTIRRKSLARLRREVEPVEQKTLARMLTRWQGIVQPRRGLDALLDAIESLQGAPLPASILETKILPARIAGYRASDLDTLIAAGEVVWVGLDSLGERDGRIALYLAEQLPALWPTQAGREQRTESNEREAAIVEYLRARGASFFQELHEGVGGGYPGETLDALWRLVWRGMVTNDGMAALRAYCEPPATSRKPGRRA